jgi:hypothetical protein
MVTVNPIFSGSNPTKIFHGPPLGASGGACGAGETTVTGERWEVVGKGRVFCGQLGDFWRFLWDFYGISDSQHGQFLLPLASMFFFQINK